MESWQARRPRTPWRRLARLVLAFALVLGLAVLSGEFLKLVERPNGSTAFDSSITSWFVAHRAAGLTTLARALSAIGRQTVLAPLSALVAVLLVRRRQFVAAALLVACWGGGLALYSLAKLIVQRQRPPAHIWLTKASGTSFPSGHATQSLATFAGLAIVVILVSPRTRAGAGLRTSVVVVLAAVGAGVIGVSRIYLGVHWATDVLAGWLLGALWVALVVWLLKPTRYVAG